MRDRIAQHREDRGEDWTTVEAPLDLSGALAQVPAGAVVLVDCATLWLTNHLLAERDLDAETRRLLAALAACAAPVAVVSNEVGWGIVPDNALARRFRDAQGRLNQRLAARADLVVGVMAGLPLGAERSPARGPRVTRLWWVRHGPTHAKDMIGWTDLPADLSDLAALARLRAHLPGEAPILSSDLVRAVATADALGADRRLPPLPALREIHFGAWEGLRFAEAEARDPALIRRFWEEPGEVSAPGGESWDDAVRPRVNRAVDGLAAGAWPAT